VTRHTEHPLLYQINARVWLRQFPVENSRTPTLADVPQAAIDGLAQRGFDWVWLLGVWQSSEIGAQLARADAGLMREASALVPDLTSEDVCGSCFSIRRYQVRPDLGGEAALADFRNRLAAQGIRLMLDFVPNHVAIDHPWLDSRPDFFIEGSQTDLEAQPGNYVHVPTVEGSRILAHGRDPNFPGWTDTLQLDYSNPDLHPAMKEQLLSVSLQCDGLRCDMAMLLLPEVFERTWGRRMQDFWPGAIAKVRASNPEFHFMAEVYWDLESRMLEQGFDWAYDKRLYDRLRQQRAVPVCAHLRAEPALQARFVRFLENHDESRAAAAFPAPVHRAAAIIAYLAPGVRFFHHGQLDGWTRRIPMQLCRVARESDDSELQVFYARLLAILRLPVVRRGTWRPLECGQAWHGNWTWEDFLCCSWDVPQGDRLLVVVNYAPHASQCFVRLPFADLTGQAVRLVDHLGLSDYERDGADLTQRGLYLDLPEWGYHVFRLEAA
jgi:hypothetical protein